MNPCEYSIATIKGNSLHDQDNIRSFGALIQRRLNQLKEQTDNLDERKWPYTPEEFLPLLESGPMPQLYNATYATLHPTIKINNAGYAETKSGKLATMIWFMASD